MVAIYKKPGKRLYRKNGKRVYGRLSAACCCNPPPYPAQCCDCGFSAWDIQCLKVTVTMPAIDTTLMGCNGFVPGITAGAVRTYQMCTVSPCTWAVYREPSGIEHRGGATDPSLVDVKHSAIIFGCLIPKDPANPFSANPQDYTYGLTVYPNYIYGGIYGTSRTLAPISVNCDPFVAEFDWEIPFDNGDLLYPFCVHTFHYKVERCDTEDGTCPPI